MQSLTVVGREDDHLIVVNSNGERFRITIDQALLDQVRRPHTPPRSSRHQASPKDIQAHMRRGLTAQQVADLTGETVDYIRRFEGPVIAEREFVAEQARAIPIGASGAGDQPATFGQLVARKLHELSATDANWSAWREESGWQVEVSFLEGAVEHHARWAFDQRKQTLTPQNDDAAVLSQAEPIRGPLIPKLRAVSSLESQDGDSFDPDILAHMPLEHTGPLLEPVPYGRTTDLLGDGDDGPATANTADLLEVLRRRRGEREPAPEPEGDSSRNAHPSTGSIRLVDVDQESNAPTGASIHAFPGSGETSVDESLGDIVDSLDDDELEVPPAPPKSTNPRRNRPEMPSWDDIVFGTRSDDDPA